MFSGLRPELERWLDVLLGAVVERLERWDVSAAYDRLSPSLLV
jgi:hypothetical protein